MALELTVNPNTVQRAYELLEREGLIEPRKGVGMFVTERGAASARGQAETMVRTRFVDGIRVGVSANIKPEGIGDLYEDAWREATGRARRKR